MDLMERLQMITLNSIRRNMFLRDKWIVMDQITKKFYLDNYKKFFLENRILNNEKRTNYINPNSQKSLARLIFEWNWRCVHDE